MKLHTQKRSNEKKLDAKRLRREGMIPAIVYRRGKESDLLTIDQAEYDALLRSIPQGRLSTTVLSLADEEGNEIKAIVKDIQYHVTSYDVLHIDLEELIPDVKVKVNVPIEFDGAIDCVGVKLGGVVRQVIRKVRVHCLPNDIPDVFRLNIKELAIGQYKKLKDIMIPEEVRPIANLDEVVVVIAKR